MAPVDYPPSFYLFSGTAPESSLLTMEVTVRGTYGPTIDSLILNTSLLPLGNDARLDTTDATAKSGLYSFHWTTASIGVYRISLTAYGSGGVSQRDVSLYVVGGDTTAADVRINVTGACGEYYCPPHFVPNPVTIHVGQRVAFDCFDYNDALHRVAQDGGGFDTYLMPGRGSSGSFLFTEPDTIEYHCTVDPTEHGTIYVVP